MRYAAFSRIRLYVYIICYDSNFFKCSTVVI